MLRFEARKLLVGSSELELVRVHDPQRAEPIDASATLVVSTRSSVLGRTRRRWTRIDPANGGGWSSLTYAESDKARRIDFRPGTCLQSIRFDPAAERGSKAETWSARKPVPITLPPAELELVDSQAIWSRLASWREQAPTRVAIATKDHWFELQVRVGRSRRQTVSVRVVESASSFSSAQQVELILEPVGANQQAGLLSFEGPLKIWLDQASGIPLEIEGKHEDAGAIRFALRALSFERQSSPQINWPALPLVAGDCAPAAPVDDHRPAS